MLLLELFDQHGLLVWVAVELLLGVCFELVKGFAVQGVLYLSFGLFLYSSLAFEFTQFFLLDFPLLLRGEKLLLPKDLEDYR